MWTSHLLWCPGNNHENIHKNHTTTRRLQYIAPKKPARLRRNRQLLPLVQPGSPSMVFISVCIFWTKRDRNPRILGGISGLNEILFCQTRKNLHETNWIDYMKNDILSYAKYGLPTWVKSVRFSPASHEFLLLPNLGPILEGHLSRKKNAGQTNRQSSVMSTSNGCAEVEPRGCPVATEYIMATVNLTPPPN